MAVECIVSGDALQVTRDGKTFALSLVVPIDRLSVWLEIYGEVMERHQKIRDEAMDGDARAVVLAVEKVDAVDAMEIVVKWSAALSGRLGKALSLSPSGGSTEQPSPPTSGSDTE